MRILHVITSMRTGGAEKLLVDLLPRLKSKNIDADLCVLNGNNTPFYEEIKSKGIKVIDFGKRNSVYNLKNIWRLRKIIRDYDIVHTHNTSPQFFVAIANIGISKTLVTTEHSTFNRRRNWNLFKFLDRLMYNQYKKIICISDKTQSLLTNYLTNIESKTIVIPNGIDLSVFRTAGKTCFEAEGCEFSLIQVAGFREAKDQDTTIKALKTLPKQIHLFLVGDGIRRDEIIKLINSENLQQRVHLLGISNEIPLLTNAADIVIISSHWEGFGLAAVEGMAAAKPVIASDVDGLREVVHGAGILFPHGNVEALTMEIMRLYSDPNHYSFIAKKCIKRATVFDISKMVESYINVYNKILNRR